MTIGKFKYESKQYRASLRDLKAEPNGANLIQAELSRVKPRQAECSRVEPSPDESNSVELSQAESSWGVENMFGIGETTQNNAKGNTWKISLEERRN